MAESQVEFYTHPVSRGKMVRWALHEVGMVYRETLVTPGNKKGNAILADIDPMIRVPALVHNGYVLTEPAAICLYLGQIHPACTLTPTNAAGWSAYYEAITFMSVTLECMLGHRARMQPDNGLSIKNHADRRDLERAMTKLSAMLRGGYVCRGQFTMADILVGGSLDFYVQTGVLSESVVPMGYLERLRERSAYKEALMIDSAHAADLHDSLSTFKPNN